MIVSDIFTNIPTEGLSDEQQQVFAALERLNIPF